MADILVKFLINLFASSLVMKHNLDWHRKLIMFFVPLFFLFIIFQTEYGIWRISRNQNDH